MDQIEEIKRKIDIVELIGEQVELKRAGRALRGLCPFHSEKTPSFMVTPELAIFKCFGCGLGGDCYRFIQEFEKVDFAQALKILADRAGVKLRPIKGHTGFDEREELYKVNSLASNFYNYILASHKVGEKARAYLGGRGIKIDAIKAFGLGYSPQIPSAVVNYLIKKKDIVPQMTEKAGISVYRNGNYFDRFRGRIIFPLKDHLGNIVGFSGRVIEDKGEIAKYVNSPDTVIYRKGRTLYGLDLARAEIKKQGKVILVEGEFDCISSWQAGIKNVVAIKGSAITEDQAQLLSRFCSEVILALDSDFAGDAAARRGLEIMQRQGLSIKVCDLGSFKDPDEASRSSVEEFKKRLNSAQEVHDFLINSVFKKYDIDHTEGKVKASREIVPILASIDDEIIRAHCIHIVAEKLSVPEDSVRGQVSKSSNRSVPLNELKRVELDSSVAFSRRDVLEEHLFSLVFNFRQELLLDEELFKNLQSPSLQRLLVEYKKFAKSGKKFTAKEFSSRLPAELVDLFAKIILSASEDYSPDFIERQLTEAKKNLSLLETKEEIGNLTRRIKILEAQGKLNEVEKSEISLTEASARLTILEANSTNL